MFFLLFSGSYVHPHVEENFSAVKLIAINPNELDEEDAYPTTPMLNQRDDDSTDNNAATNGLPVSSSGGSSFLFLLNYISKKFIFLLLQLY